MQKNLGGARSGGSGAEEGGGGERNYLAGGRLLSLSQNDTFGSATQSA